MRAMVEMAAAVGAGYSLILLEDTNPFVIDRAATQVHLHSQEQFRRRPFENKPNHLHNPR